MKLIVVRHGETEENAKRMLMGHMHGTLSGKGRLQAKKIALRLRNTKIDRVFSSDLMRARRTTEEIVRYHNVPLVYTKELREQNYGVLQGRHLDYLLAAMKRTRKSRLRYRPKRGESIMDMKIRVGKFVRSLNKKKEYKNETLLISAHAGIAWVIFSMYGHVPLAKAMKMHPKNTGLFTVEINDKGSKIIEDRMFK